MERFSIITILIIISVLNCSAKRYQYLAYNEIINKMVELSEKFSRYCKLFDVKKENSYIIDTYCGKLNCEHWYLHITDFNAPTDHINSLPQVFFLGGIHGDEGLGPNIVIQLAEYLLQKNEEDEAVTNLIKTRLIILLPLANPSGYYLNRRDEKQISGTTLDPNRDFPYNVKSSTCLRSASARVINHIFKTHLIQAAVTFHGGTQSITYPWGAFNHILSTSNPESPKAEECPDNRAFSDVANILSKEAGSNSFLFIKPYPTGRMTDVVYAVNGGLEDWAYGASWETKFSPNIIPRCDDTAQPVPLPTSETDYNAQSLRTLIYLVETSETKTPTSAYLGASEGLEGGTDKYAYGYIPINIRLCLSLIDIVEPYVKIKSLDYSEEKSTLTVQWQGGGCKKVDATYLEWSNKEGDSVFTKSLPPQQGPGYFENNDFVYQEVINLNSSKFKMDITIKLTCDQDWGLQKSPSPSVEPQTHVVQARINQDYYAEANGYKITGKKVIEHSIKGINTEYLMKTRITNIRDLSLMIEFMECPGLGSAGSITAQIIDNQSYLSLQFMGKLNLEDPFLEGHLHEYGDISRCPESIGETINTATFKNDQNYEHSLMFLMEKDEIKTVKINYQLKLAKESDVLEMIGKSILLERKTHSDKIYVGQIVPLQPTSCKKAPDMRNCLGVNLGSREGICIMKVALEEAIHDFKLFIAPGADGKSVKISGFVPNQIMDHYYKFDEIFIVHEKNEKKFFINKKTITGFGLIEENSFNLYPDIALGTVLRVYVQAFGDKLLLGDCSIGLRDPKFNETTYLIEHFTLQQKEKATAIRSQIFLFLLACVLLIIAALATVFLIKRYRKVKLQSFEGAMSARKERYADTARMISTARGVASARGIPAGGALGSVRDSASARAVLNFGTNRNSNRDAMSVPTAKRFERRKSESNIDLPENYDEEYST